MKILVCIKHVPDTNARVKINPEGNALDFSEAEWIVSPYDEIAVEQAVRLKEAAGEAEVVVVSCGPKAAEKTIRNGCLAMKADRGILLEDAQPRDPLATGKALAAVIAAEKPDLVLFGWKAYGDDYAQVAGLTCALAGIPLLSTAIKMEVDQGQVTIESEIEGGYEIVQAPLPCAVSVQKGLAEPRIRSLREVRAARKKEVRIESPEAVANILQQQKISPPPTRPMGKIVGEGADAVPALVKLLHEEAKVL